MGTLDFFLLEASEYLERLDAEAQAPAGQGAPSDDLVRLSRAFRGSALMASQHGIAKAAQGLEAVSRALRDGRLAWDDRVRGEVIRAVDDCKVMLRGLRQPDPADMEKADALGAHLERLAGRPSAAARAASAGLDAGARAFVAREAAAIASALQRTAQSLAADPSHREPVGALVPAMSALRGVAVISDLPPLAEILGAVEGAAKEVAGLAGPVPGAGAAAFDAGAKALARAAREVVDAGRPVPDSEEARTFASALLAAFTAPRDVVNIESLFYGDAGPHIVRQGIPPSSGGGMARVEMVSQGEFLRAATTELRKAASPIQRDLKLFAVAANLRPMMNASGSPLATATSGFAEAVRDAVGRFRAGFDLQGFLAAMDQASDAFCNAQGADDGSLTTRLIGAARAIATLAAAPEPVPEAIPERAVVAPPVPSVSSVTPVPSAPDDLALSFATFEQLLAERGLPMSSLDELLSGPAPALAVAAAAPVPSAPPPEAAPAPAAPRRPVAPTRPIPVVPVEDLAPEERVVPIEALFYRGDRALARIMELRPQVLAAAQGGNGSDLGPLLKEVFDLVELGRSAER